MESHRSAATEGALGHIVSTFVIGDIHGCYDTLQRLLKRMSWNPDEDRLWLTGDLVNRGEKSLKVLRWAKSLQDRVTVVLGNHDLHLLTLAEGCSDGRSKVALQKTLSAPDRDELLDWLRRRPVLHREGGFVLVHAGLHPDWSMKRAEKLARKIESRLRSKGYRKLLRAVALEESAPIDWSSSLTGVTRSAAALRIMTLLRAYSGRRKLLLDFSGALSEAPKGTKPWFDAPVRKRDKMTFLFGHWAAHGLHVTEHAIGLDSGCVWGGCLTAVRLEDRVFFQEPC